ncbi:hypothetical protein TRFO_41337 [Tritrichomonas foetus]|uniref:Tetraspanin family protein n=1 Tax=Tritrichomonas foetus TaxID=1144522 RepID=A0A1J4L1W3_9EUKA|nr:hypothetical protein TRFO_41337 [Tritrichomonas foetus]|eukprot:OHT17064.1 hypothetical protein TRFO_41337 [Tritrichomonas foetus]
MDKKSCFVALVSNISLFCITGTLGFFTFLLASKIFNFGMGPTIASGIISLILLCCFIFILYATFRGNRVTKLAQGTIVLIIALVCVNSGPVILGYRVHFLYQLEKIWTNDKLTEVKNSIENKYNCSGYSSSTDMIINTTQSCEKFINKEANALIISMGVVLILFGLLGGISVYFIFASNCRKPGIPQQLTEKINFL